MVNIFISYRHRDIEWVDTDSPKDIRDISTPNSDISLISYIKEHFRNRINIWFDKNLYGGDDFTKIIEEHLEQADICILMLSDNFFNSTYIIDKEIPFTLKKYFENKLRIFPIWISDITSVATNVMKSILPEEIISNLSQASLEDVFYQKGKYYFDKNRREIIDKLEQTISIIEEDYKLYNQIISENSKLEICHTYLEKYGEKGKYSQEVTTIMQRLEKLEKNKKQFEQALCENDINLLQSIATEQDNNYALQARDSLISIAEKSNNNERILYSLLNKDNPITYINYIREYSHSEGFTAVWLCYEQMIEKAYKQINNINNIEKMQSFIDAFYIAGFTENNRHIKSALNRIKEYNDNKNRKDDAAFAKAQKEGTYQSYTKYIDNGYERHLKEAETEIRQIHKRKKFRKLCIRGIILLVFCTFLGYALILRHNQKNVTVELFEGNFPNFPDPEIYKYPSTYSFGGIAKLEAYPERLHRTPLYDMNYINSAGTTYFNLYNDSAVYYLQKRIYGKGDSLLDIAVRQNNPVAIYNKSLRSFPNKMQWLKKSANMNYPVAITEQCLYQCETEKEITDARVVEVLHIMKKASLLGDGKASYICGNIYKQFSQNDKAKEYWLLGAKQGYAYAMRYYLQSPNPNLEELYNIVFSEYQCPKVYLRPIEEKDLLPILSELAYKMKKEGYKELGFNALNKYYQLTQAYDRELFWMYFYGEGTEKNDEKAYEMLRNYKYKGDSEIYHLALMNLYGKGVSQNPDSIITYLQNINYKNENSDNQNQYAPYKYVLGRVLLENKSNNDGWIYINAAAGAGYEQAKLYQACAYAQGKYGMKTDINNAMKCFDQLLKAKDDSCKIWAAYNKGVILCYGAFGYPANRKEGLEILVNLRDHKKFKPAAPILRKLYNLDK